MNPESTLNVSDITSICKEQGIEHVSHERIKTGFSNEVYRVNSDLILKVYPVDRSRQYKTELAMLTIDTPIPRPKLVATSSDNTIIGRSYSIIEFIDGKSLGSCWHLLTQQQRKELIESLCGYLREFNRIDKSVLPTAKNGNWQDILKFRLDDLSDKLLSQSIINTDQVTKARSKFEASRQYLATEELFPVNWDIHFDNIIIDDNNNIKAIIDLENIEIMALDYPLYGIREVMEQPHRYMSEENEKYAKKEDYASLWDWYNSFYPEMFAFEHLEERISIYRLLDSMHLLQSYSHNQETVSRFERLIT